MAKKVSKVYKTASKQLKSSKKQYKLETDISGFYDTIQHNILFDILKN